MEYAYDENASPPAITLSGRFTYDDSARFHELISSWDFAARPSPLFDCRYLTFVDSTAIGMLFLFARHCQEHGGRPTIHNPHASVAQTLKRVSMDLFIDVR